MNDQSETGSESSMNEVVAGLPTKSAKIRALDQAGYSRSEIAKFLGIRYQHVWNVLAQATKQLPEQVRITIGADGRIVLPASYRTALGLTEGDAVLLRLHDGEVRVTSALAGIRRAQNIVRQHVPEGTRLSEELIAERRAEAGREAQ